MATPKLEFVAETESKCKVFLVNDRLLRLRDNYVEIYRDAGNWSLVKELPFIDDATYGMQGVLGSSCYFFEQRKDGKEGDMRSLIKITVKYGRYWTYDELYKTPKKYVFREADSESFYCSNLSNEPLDLMQPLDDSHCPKYAKAREVWRPKGYSLKRALFASGKMFWREISSTNHITFTSFNTITNETKSFDMGETAADATKDKKMWPYWAFKNEKAYTIVGQNLYLWNTQEGCHPIPFPEQWRLVDVDNDGWVYISTFSEEQQDVLRISKFMPDVPNANAVSSNFGRTVPTSNRWNTDFHRPESEKDWKKAYEESEARRRRSEEIANELTHKYEKQINQLNHQIQLVNELEKEKKDARDSYAQLYQDNTLMRERNEDLDKNHFDLKKKMEEMKNENKYFADQLRSENESLRRKLDNIMDMAKY